MTARAAPAAEPDLPAAGRTGLPRRAWTARTGPAAVAAALIAAASGYLLAGLVAARVAPGERLWPRRAFSQTLARYSWDSPWTLAAASALTLLGLVVLWLAFTPGRRGLCPVAPIPAPISAPPPEAAAELAPAPVGVFVSRRAVAHLLAERARRTPGVATASARWRGRTAWVRAEQEFGAGPGVPDELRQALADCLAGVGLARAPRLRVRLADGARR